MINIYRSQKLEWNCFVHFSVKEFLYNIFLSLIFYSVLPSVIQFPHSFEIQCFTAAIFAIKISVQKNSFSVKQQLCIYCKRNQTNMCFTGICYQRNYRQHTKVRSVGSNSLWASIKPGKRNIPEHEKIKIIFMKNIIIIIIKIIIIIIIIIK